MRDEKRAKRASKLWAHCLRGLWLSKNCSLPANMLNGVSFSQMMASLKL